MADRHDIEPTALAVLGAFLDELPAERDRVKAAVSKWADIGRLISDYVEGDTSVSLRSALQSLFTTGGNYLGPDGWKGKAADEFLAWANTVGGFGQRVSDNAIALGSVLQAVADALDAANTQYNALKLHFDGWTGALANIINVQHQYWVNPLSTIPGSLPALPWIYQVRTFQEFENAHLAGSDLSAQARDARPGSPALTSAIANTGSATFMLHTSSADGQIYTYFTAQHGAKHIAVSFPDYLNPAKWDADYAVIQNLLRDILRDPELFAVANDEIINGSGGLAQAYDVITLPTAAYDKNLPTINR